MTAIRTRGAGKAEYKQLASAKITKNRNLVVSECSKGGYTIAQQVMVSDEVSSVSMFMKGAYHIADLDALIAVRDALDVAIGKAIEEDEAETEEGKIDWDN